MVRAELLEHLDFFFGPKYLWNTFQTDFEIFLNYQVFTQPKLCCQKLEAPDTQFVQLYLEIRAVSILVAPYWIGYLLVLSCVCLFSYFLQCLSLSQSFYILSSQALQPSRISFLETLENLFLTWSLIIPPCKSSGQFSVQLLLTQQHV